MEKRLILLGPGGCGKSAVLREVLGKRLQMAGGYVTERISDDAGSFIGYGLLPAAAAGGAVGFEPALYLDCRAFPPLRDHGVFSGTAVRLLQEALWYPFALLDELGGYELLLPQYRLALEAYLRSAHPCVGALRSAEDAETLRSLLGLGDKYPRFRQALEDSLRADRDTLLLELREDNADRVRAALERWAAAWTL